MKLATFRDGNAVGWGWLKAAGPLQDPATLHFAPVIPDAGRILCVGINYLEHIHEMGREKPDYPMLFTRFPDTLGSHIESGQFRYSLPSRAW